MEHKSYDFFNEMDEHAALMAEEAAKNGEEVKPEVLEDYDGFDKKGFKYNPDTKILMVKAPETDRVIKPFFGDNPIKGIELFNKNGKFANLNNLTMRTVTFNILKEHLIQHFVSICKEDAEKQGKSRTHFCLYESALRWLTQYLDDENYLVGTRTGEKIKLNTKQLKYVLKTSAYELSDAQSTALIKLAKKADILRQKGRGDNSCFIMNPVFNNGAYVGRISRKALIEFNEAIKGLFAEKQYIDCMNYLADNDELPKELVKELNLDEQ